MTVKNGVNSNNIQIAFYDEILYGNDWVYDTRPIRFPTVGFMLMSTNYLNKIVDNARAKLGHLPMYPESEENEYDCDGWYDFYYGLNGLDENKVDGIIQANVKSENVKDDGCVYYIDVPAEDRPEMYRILNNQFIEYLDMSIEGLLAEAEKERRFDYGELSEA